MVRSYLDENGNLLWVPDDPGNLHYQRAAAGELAVCDANGVATKAAIEAARRKRNARVKAEEKAERERVKAEEKAALDDNREE